MHRGSLGLTLAGGGAAWALHLLAGYFVVSLGCARHWPALGGTLASVTGICAAGALAVAIAAWRTRRRDHDAADDGETFRLLLGVAVLLDVLFAIMIVLGGMAVAALPPCQAAVGGSP
jgi:hypothetical protein